MTVQVWQCSVHLNVSDEHSYHFMIMFSLSKFVSTFRTSALVWLVLVVTRFSRQTTFRPKVHLTTRSALGIKRGATFTRFEWVLLATVTTPGG